MRDAIKLRVATPEDAPQLVEWLNATPHYDPDILTYDKVLSVLAAYNGETVAYLPMQRVMMLESVAASPKADALTLAAALSTLVKGATLLADKDGIREIYFLATDESVSHMAKSHGFEELTCRVLRMKL